MTHIQLAINFESSTSTEVKPGAETTSLPPLFVRPDRQMLYEGAATHDDWPDAKSLHDRYTITVDRIVADADGPTHRFVIKQGDVVRVSLGSERFRSGIVTFVSHVHGEVRVSLCEGSEVPGSTSSTSTRTSSSFSGPSASGKPMSPMPYRRSSAARTGPPLTWTRISRKTR